MSEQAHVIFRGRVQGVCFRAYTEKQARALQLTGWVRNRADGTVEALFCGNKETIERGIEQCRQGPPSALVESVEVSWQEPDLSFDTFTIRY